MKRLTIFLLVFGLCISSLFPQGFNNDKTELGFFCERMYKSAPFEGVKAMKDYDHEYILSVVVLPVANYSTEQEMNRVAMVKAQRQVSTFFNGSSITSDLVITTTEDPVTESVVTSLTETIRERTFGYVRQLELLTNFLTKKNTQKVFVFYKEL